MYWIYSTYSLILTVSDAKQHLKMFWSDCLKERQEFMIKFQFTIISYMKSLSSLRNALKFLFLKKPDTFFILYRV